MTVGIYDDNLFGSQPQYSDRYHPFQQSREISVIEAEHPAFLNDADQAIEQNIDFETYIEQSWKEIQAASIQFYRRFGEALEPDGLDEFAFERTHRKEVYVKLEELFEQSRDPQVAVQGLVIHYRDAYRLAESLRFLATDPDMTRSVFPAQEPTECRSYKQTKDGKWRVTSTTMLQT